MIRISRGTLINQYWRWTVSYKGEEVMTLESAVPSEIDNLANFMRSSQITTEVVYLYHGNHHYILRSKWSHNRYEVCSPTGQALTSGDHPTPSGALREFYEGLIKD